MHGALWRCIPRNGAAFRLEPWRGQRGGLLVSLGPPSSNAEHRTGPGSLSHLWHPLMSGVDSGQSICDLAVSIGSGEARHVRGRMCKRMDPGFALGWVTGGWGAGAECETWLALDTWAHLMLRVTPKPWAWTCGELVLRSDREWAG